MRQTVETTRGEFAPMAWAMWLVMRGSSLDMAARVADPETHDRLVVAFEQGQALAEGILRAIAPSDEPEPLDEMLIQPDPGPP